MSENLGRILRLAGVPVPLNRTPADVLAMLIEADDHDRADAAMMVAQWLRLMVAIYS